MPSSKQEWQSHDLKPKAGRKLALLAEEELVFALPLIFRLIPIEETKKRKDWFVSFDTEQQQLTHYLALAKLLTQLTKKRRAAQGISNELLTANTCLNQYFSDHGWRMVRKELSQIKKRKKKSHIELSNDLIFRLKAYISLKQLDSFDQAIDNLLSESEAHLNELE
ncbi:hypothetical protein [Shewanella youngdeokensis]|uniref:Uncharacterized protein n=1 Tax=Shewanella youngdeokensis TaxID=2999068 RepID=A0ABZ0K2V7_9GAMM|nr:hypothetical protein RGE70_09100 [Shewanella sp. DAU334]